MAHRIVSGQRADSTTASGEMTKAKAQKSFDKYVALARDAKGDSVEREDCYQHADHFWRVMKELTG
jgi:hypothetical protein